MEYRKLGKSNLEISEITLGCWAMGAGKEWGLSLADKVYQETVVTAFEHGINFFDTASGYGGGHSEEVLGKAIKGFREKVILSSKCSATGLTRENARSSVEMSLSRLGTDVIDVFFIHWPSPEVPVEEPIEQLMKLKDEGKIRSIGVSNFTLAHLERAVRAGQVDVLQPSYSLYWRHIERDLMPYCIENDIGIISYSSIAQGLLTGKFTKDWKFEETDMRNGKIPLFISPTYEMAIDSTEKIRKIAEKYGKTAVQAAINWTINKKGITSAIVGAKRPEQVLENVGATGWKLSDEDRAEIAAFTMEVARTVMDWDTMYLKDDHRLVIRD
ncbi:MAG TPA: aldo/keto reductase [Clostridia bacterium]|nr:aldo/keto reductase [Clostridia bacterium]HRX42575.1 aldo/keto reductase [Clostridia bacterium]